MKSIMQEASSIAKAIEKGWEKAGKPTDFSVKIYEEPQKNFIGLTTKPAKIALFFDEAKSKRPEPKAAEEPRRVVERRELVEKNKPQRRTQSSRTESRQESTYMKAPAEQSPAQKTSSRTESRQYNRSEVAPRQESTYASNMEAPEAEFSSAQKLTRHAGASTKAEKVPTTTWTPDMLEIVQDWLAQVLMILGKSSVKCVLEVDQYLLRVSFSDAILDSASKDKLLFRSFAFLLMQLLRGKARKRLRGLKIIFATQQG